MKAIIIDDEALLAENLADIFEDEDVFASVDVCTSPEALENKLNETQYDIYFIDKNFSYINGIDFYTRNSNLFKDDSMIIFMYGEDISADIDKETYNFEVLPKPFNINEALDLVKKIAWKCITKTMTL